MGASEPSLPEVITPARKWSTAKGRGFGDFSIDRDKLLAKRIMNIDSLHHVSLPVTDLERSRRFYREVLGLREIARPNFNFPGAWFQLGSTQQLHLIVHANPTFRTGKSLDTRDIHFAARVGDYWKTVEFLHSKGYREDAAPDDLLRIIVNPRATAGFPQMYILDPDRNVIELNAAAAEPTPPQAG
jgi:catechol 2,3-dioxygenase-like lactoylglutathione lyase family enzyme